MQMSVNLASYAELLTADACNVSSTTTGQQLCLTPRAPKLPDNEVNAAIHMVMCMYLYATMVSITELEMAGVL